MPRSQQGTGGAVCRREDGLVVEGRLVDETEDGVYLLQANPSGGLATVFVPFCETEGAGEERKSAVAISKSSMMPDTKGVLSKEEIDALVAFLRNRNGNK